MQNVAVPDKGLFGSRSLQSEKRTFRWGRPGNGKVVSTESLHVKTPCSTSEVTVWLVGTIGEERLICKDRNSSFSIRLHLLQSDVEREAKESSAEDSLPESMSAATESIRKLSGSELSEDCPTEVLSFSGSLIVILLPGVVVVG